MSRWYRAYEGVVTDAKLGEVALVAACSRSVAIATWHAILESAAAAQAGGGFDTTPRRVAVILGEPIATIDAVFAEMTALGMLDGSSVSAWKARQFESDNSTERSRKHRERSRNADATLQGRCATPPYTETYTDTETEKKKEEPRKRAARAKTRIPPDAIISEQMRAAAEQRGLSDAEAEAQFVKFRDWASAKGQAYVDWDAAWRNWLTSPYFAPVLGASVTTLPKRGSTYGERLDDAFNEIEARLAVQPFRA